MGAAVAGANRRRGNRRYITRRNLSGGDITVRGMSAWRVDSGSIRTMPDLPPDVLAHDPVLRQLRERIAELEAEIAECQRQECQREEALRIERTPSLDARAILARLPATAALARGRRRTL